MIFSSHEAGGCLPAAPETPSQSKEGDGLGTGLERSARYRGAGCEAGSRTPQKRKVMAGPLGRHVGEPRPEPLPHSCVSDRRE